MKIKCNSDDDLPLNKTLEMCNMILVVRAVFHENNKYYPQTFLMNVYISYKRYILRELTFVRKIMLIKQMNKKSAIFFTIGIF